MDRYLQGFAAGEAAMRASALQLMDRAMGKGFLIGTACGGVMVWLVFGGAL